MCCSERESNREEEEEEEEERALQQEPRVHPLILGSFWSEGTKEEQRRSLMLSLSLCRCFAGVVPAKRSPKLVVSITIFSSFVCVHVHSTEWKERYLKNKRHRDMISNSCSSALHLERLFLFFILLLPFLFTFFSVYHFDFCFSLLLFSFSCLLLLPRCHPVTD